MESMMASMPTRRRSILPGTRLTIMASRDEGKRSGRVRPGMILSASSRSCRNALLEQLQEHL
jgi:hypothetical protein